MEGWFNIGLGLLIIGLFAAWADNKTKRRK